MAATAAEPPEGFKLQRSDFGVGKVDIAPLERLVGPLFVHPGRRAVGLWARPEHCNGALLIHGGLLSLLADVSLFTIARGTFDTGDSAGGITSSLVMDFLGVCRPGVWLEASGEVIKDGKESVHVSGTIRAQEEGGRSRLAASFRGVIRKLRKQRPKL